MNEAWQILSDFPDYAVSNLGRVMRVTGSGGRGGSCTYVGKKLKLFKDKDGYSQVNLCKKGKCRRRKVHRLVMLAFIGPCPKGHEVNHINGTKDYNNWLNLEYVTRQGNADHAREKGLKARGQRQPLAKLTEKDVFKIVLLSKEGMSQRGIAKKFRMSESSIHSLLSGVSWSWLTGIKRKKKRVY